MKNSELRYGWTHQKMVLQRNRNFLSFCHKKIVKNRQNRNGVNLTPSSHFGVGTLLIKLHLYSKKLKRHDKWSKPSQQIISRDWSSDQEKYFVSKIIILKSRPSFTTSIQKFQLFLTDHPAASWFSSEILFHWLCHLQFAL